MVRNLKDQLTSRSPSRGKVRDFSEAEQAAYCACEEVLAIGWHPFVQVGLALARYEPEKGALARETRKDAKTELVVENWFFTDQVSTEPRITASFRVL